MKTLTILLIFAFPTICEGATFWVPTDVKIINGLGPRTDLNIRCRSKNDNLGLHSLLPGGSFEFRFRPNYWRTTRFYCSFRWSGQFRRFDIFVHKRDDCRHCTWMIRTLGPCRCNQDNKKYDKCYPWDKD